MAGTTGYKQQTRDAVEGSCVFKINIMKINNIMMYDVLWKRSL